VGNVLRELRAGGVDGIWGREGIERSELIERADDLLWFGQNRDGVSLEAGARSVPRHRFSWERGRFNGALFRGSWRVGYGVI
jgi:hypothetical protein